ncbi:MAG: ABC transporter permease [Candidatus Shapirobacteria bacterium]|nr:ABC transporter permease [Candidatus Shapirobacteria bacterium]MDD5073772.1 ABC transporter permease [Candidatus Shapirobacteria bacterium]MDD5481627.1 ABC transporter permease [Candidatus Shapirobacteria bacterium]
MLFNLEIFKVALRSLWANKVRSFLTMLGIIIGVAAVITLVSIGAGLKVYIADQFEALGSNLIYIYPGDLSSGFGERAMISQTRLENQHRQAIDRLDLPIGAISALVQIADQAKYKENTFNTIVFGVESAYSQVVNVDLEMGRFFTESEEERRRRVAIVGSRVVEEIFSGIDPLGKSFFLGGSAFEVVGILEEQGGGAMGSSSVDDTVIVPLKTAELIFAQEDYGAIIVKAESESDIDQIKAAIKKELLDYFDEEDFSVLDQRQILNQIDNILGMLTLALGGIAAISLLVGGIGIMNIMLVSVTERTAEIGLRKAVGAQNKDILVQFIIESVFLSIVGGSIGVIFGFLGSLLIGSFLQTTVTPWSVFLAFSISSLIGVVFGVAPARKAARLDPIEALRY